MEEQKTCEEILQSAMPDTTDDLDDVLQHWGIKGQKWGVRRYQNKDGSLTPQGRKRYGSLEEAVGALNAARIKAKRKKQLKKARAAAAEKRKADEEAKAKEEQRKKDVDDGKVSARDMTADELQRRIDKLNLEKRYKQLLNETNPSAETISAGKQFAKKMWNDAVQPAVANATKEIVGNYLKDVAKRQFGIKESDIDILNKEYKRLDVEQKISNAKKTIYDNDRHMKGEDVDDKMPNFDERIKIKNNPDLASEAEKARYRRQGWFNDGNDSSSDSNSSSENTSSNKTDSGSSGSSKQTSSSDNSSSNLPSSVANTRVNSDRFEANAEVGIKAVNELKDKYGSHILYMSDGDPNELYHWGIKGQKWGVRRFQNKNGSLTPEGKKRYSEDSDSYKSSLEIKNPNRAREIDRKMSAKGSINPLYSQNSPYSNRKNITMAYKSDNLYRASQELYRKASKEGFTKKLVDDMDRIQDQIASKYGKEYAKATLKDLGVKNITKDDIDYAMNKIRSKENLYDRDDVNALQIFGDKHLREMTSDSDKHRLEREYKIDEINAKYKKKYDEAVSRGDDDIDIELIELERMEELDEYI